MAQIPGGVSLDKRRVREQRHRDRLQCKAGAELAPPFGLAAVVEIGLHRAGAQHHVEAEPALFRHVVAHDAVAALRHERHLVAPRQRVEAEPDHAEPQFVANLAHLPQMLVNLLAGLVQGFERRAAQFELPARFERDRTTASFASAITLPFSSTGFPAEAGHALEQRTDAVRSLIRHPLQIGAAEDEFFVFGADAPRARRLAAAS